MPVVDKRNISLGIGVIEFGEFVNDEFTEYKDVGAVKSEVNITHEREVLDFETGRPLVVILQEVIRERVTLSATLAELSLATIKQALGQGNLTTSVVPTFADGTSEATRGTLQTGSTSVGTGTLLKFGGLPSHSFVGIRFTHAKSSGQRQIFEGYRCSPSGNLTLPFRESDWNLFSVEFRLLADTEKPAGEQYYQLFIEGQ